jgi:WD40 repeat protein
MLFAAHDAPLNALTLTPDQIIAGADNGIIVWDRATGQEVRRMTGHTTPVRAVAITPTGLIVSASTGGTIRIWDPTTGAELREPFAGHNGRTMAITPNGEFVIAGNDNGELLAWNLNDTNEFGRPIPVHDGDITAVAAISDTMVASVGLDKRVQITDIVDGNSVTLQELRGRLALRALVATAGGARLLAGGADGMIYSWDSGVDSGTADTMRGHNGPIESLAITADGLHLASAGVDGTVRFWNLAHRQQVGEPLAGHDGAVAAVAFTPDGAQIVSVGSDHTIHIWDRPDHGVFHGHSGAVYSVAVDSRGTEILSGGQDGNVRTWDRASGRMFVRASHAGRVTSVAWTQFDDAVSGSDDSVLKISSDWTDAAINTGHAGGIRSISTDWRGSASIVTAGWDDHIQIWAERSQHLVDEFRTDQQGGIRSITVTSDGSQVISGGADGTIRVWDCSTKTFVGEPIGGHTGKVLALAVTPDDHHFVSGDEGGMVRIWDRATGQLVGEPLSGHVGAVWSIVVAPNGARILSGGEDGTIRIWNRVTGEFVDSLSGHAGPVYALATTSEGNWIVSGGADGTVRVWPPPPNSLVGPIPLAGVMSDLESEEDRLGIAGDVQTIAALVAALSTKPPLSVALLGDWGIGKSSFMRLMRDRVAELARQSAGGQSAFAANVRQVRFNAWHYSDDHLWVGLVEHLFRELAEPVEGDGTARRRELEEELSERKAARDRLAEDLRRVERRRGLLTLFRSAQVARATISGLWQELRSGGWRTWVALLVLAAGAAGIVLGEGVLRWLGGVVAVLGPVAVAWRRLGEYTEVARRQLADRKSEVDAEIRTTEEELSRVDPARRLDKLLKEISTADRYESYRGLTGRIHHDLRRLSEDLAAAREQWDGTGTPPLQRIVLYVDDLDRCTPSRVVDVLQAVNLLLTMDLFVVVVAVDPRWLLRSLRRHHEGLFDANEVAYLDKIFHIPVALRPMGDRAVGYLRSLLPKDEVPAQRPVRQEPAAQEAPRVAATAKVPARQVVASSNMMTSNVVTRPPRPDLSPEGLRLRSQEREFLERLTPLLGTPRAIKKLVNLYRLLRLGVGEARLGEFLGGTQGGPHQAAALLLAALVGAPHDARKLLQGLASVEPGKDIVDVVPSPGLRDVIVRIRKDIPVHGDSATYKRWATTVARYGFETYDLFSG